MTIYWEPVEDDINPDNIDVWHVQDDGKHKEIGPVDVSDVSGMPDDIGGTAPNAVRLLAEDTLNKTAYEADRRIEYVRGTPA